MYTTKTINIDDTPSVPLLKIPPKTNSKFFLLIYYIKQHWLSYLLGIFAIFLTNWIAVSIPEYIQLSIDLLDDNLKAKQDLLFKYFLIMLGLSLIMIIVRIFSRILFFNPGRSIECQIKNDMFKKSMSLQKNFYEINPTGNIISRINNDITGVRLLCGFGLMQVFNISTSLSMTPFKMWQLSPNLMIYCFIPIVFVFIIVRLGMNILVKNMRLRMESLQRLSGFSVSSLSAIDIVKTGTMNKWCVDRFEKENQNMLFRSMKIAWIRSFVMPMLNNLEHFLKLFILLIGGMMVIEDKLTIGELTAFITYAALLTIPLTGLGWVTTMFQQGWIGLASIQSILSQDEPRTKLFPLPKSHRKKLFLDGGLTVNNLNFRYPGEKIEVLKNVNFTIRTGQIVGILGRIGSGKSTLINCLNRYLETEESSIFLGDKDINSLSDKDIRSTIRTVTQEPFLFSDTVEKNINFAIDEYNSEDTKKLWDIIRKTSLEKEVLRFPKKEKTLVGERGIMLSGGQKQRISLARAFMKPCDILILDNALSSIDYDTEKFLLKEIYKMLLPEKNKLAPAKSIIIVSNRVTLMEKVDWILVLDDGEVVDQGQHEDLIKRTGYYQQMWKLQEYHST